jgi:tetratricopeptide (TPR) repeat protein
MRNRLLAALMVLIAASAHAGEYGNYDPMRLLTASQTSSGKKFGFDGAYLDRMLDDLSAHARNYPPRFDTPHDRERAVRDVKTVSGMLDVLINVPTPNPEILLRAGILNSIGHNLDIAGSADKADAAFRRLLAAVPAHPRGSLMYGTFLAGAGKPGAALRHLETALAAGVDDAAYALGMTYLSMGNREQALAKLEEYQRRRPGDASLARLIDAVRNGRIELK